jgi:stage V sporulation protein B
MKPTSVSQVLEALVKLIVGLAAALLLGMYTTQKAYPAAGAIFGVTMSCLLSSVYLNYCFRKAYKDIPETAEPVSSGKEIAKGLLAIAIPITIGSAGLQILTVLETKIYMGQLLQTMTQNQADVQKGIYNFTQKIFNMPCAFITPITISAIPAITAQITRKEFAAAKATEESAARVTALMAAPCAVGLAVLAQPVTALLGGYSGQKLLLATDLMTILGICILFNATVLLTNAIMQAHGHVNLPVINMFVGGVVKLVAVFILTGNPNIGILGTPIGSLLCYVSITVLNLITMAKVLPNAPRIVRNMLRAVTAALIMGVVVFCVYYGIEAFLAPGSRIISCGAPIAVGALVYVFAAVKLKAITREDCLLLPKGEKIANLLKL